MKQLEYYGWPPDSPPDHGDAADKARIFESWMDRCLGQGLVCTVPMTVTEMIKTAPYHLQRVITGSK